MTRFAVILPAGGVSSRFGSDKLDQQLGGMRVIDRTLAAFQHRQDVVQIVVAGRELLGTTFAPGGDSRAQSVRNALELMTPEIEWIAIHDAARPLVSQDLITRTLAAAGEHGAAGPALPVHLTIKQSTGALPSKIERTLPRSQLWGMQTPQIMRRIDLVEAFDRCPVPLDQITDDLQLLELIGKPTWLVAGEERNLKITTPLDLVIARSFLSE